MSQAASRVFFFFFKYRIDLVSHQFKTHIWLPITLTIQAKNVTITYNDPSQPLGSFPVSSFAMTP